MLKKQMMLLFMICSCSLCADEAKNIQGLYEGVGESKGLIARVVAHGKEGYVVYIQKDEMKNDPVCVEVKGKSKDNTVQFSGTGYFEGWELLCANGILKGKSSRGKTVAFRRVKRKSPTLGKKPPEGAIAILDGKSFDEMRKENWREWQVADKSKEGWGVWEVAITTTAKHPKVLPTPENPIPEGWTLTQKLVRVEDMTIVADDGSIQIPKGGMESIREFECSFDYHVEFMIPFEPEERSQHRGNSGVFFPNGNEIQVLDAFGMPTYWSAGCGGLYDQKDPDIMQDIPSLKGENESKFNLAALPPLQWQTYDIEYRVKKDEQGNKAAYVTAYHNGIKIHDNVKLGRAFRKGKLHYQDHNNPVRYRNIWALTIE